VGRIARDEGRRLFGSDPSGYDLARPGHAERVYEVLLERCGLGRGKSMLEVGPGTGQATRRLLEPGADPLVVLEPDAALAAYLHEALGDRVDLRQTTLEDADLETERFDLAAAASSFHWVDEQVGLAKIFSALRRGGWVATWWTLFGDGEQPDAFITATTPLLEDLQASPTAGEEGRPPHARDVEARSAALGTAASSTSSTSSSCGRRAGTPRESAPSTPASRRYSVSTTRGEPRFSTRSRGSPSRTSGAASAAG